MLLKAKLRKLGHKLRNKSKQQQLNCDSLHIVKSRRLLWLEKYDLMLQQNQNELTGVPDWESFTSEKHHYKTMAFWCLQSKKKRIP